MVNVFTALFWASDLAKTGLEYGFQLPNGCKNNFNNHTFSIKIIKVKLKICLRSAGTRSRRINLRLAVRSWGTIWTKSAHQWPKNSHYVRAAASSAVFRLRRYISFGWIGPGSRSKLLSESQRALSSARRACFLCCSEDNCRAHSCKVKKRRALQRWLALRYQAPILGLHDHHTFGVGAVAKIL